MGKKPAKNIQEVYFTKDHQMVRKAVADFVKKEINPYVDEWEENGKIPLHDLFKKMADLGFLGISHEQEYGGEGLDLWYETVFLEELGQIDALGVPLAILVQTFMATPAIKEFGSDYLKEKYLKGAISGDLVSAIGVTEPDAGSDVSALKTTARREGDYYIVNGSKTFITNGTQADFVTTLVRTSDDPGYHCFSLLVIPTDLPGFQVSKKLDKLGCIAIVLEAVPQHVGAAVRDAVSIPVVGVGAGLDVDGQALVLPDMLGLSTDFKPKFVRTYMNGADLIKDAVNKFAADVHAKAFPSAEETYAPGKGQDK